MDSMPEFKHARTRKFPVQQGRRRAPRPETWVFLAHHPEANKRKVPNFVVPAGPGMGMVPEKGRWYCLTEYLARRIMHRELTEVEPTEPYPFDPVKEPVKETKPKGKKK
jgi:hypothetical protein